MNLILWRHADAEDAHDSTHEGSHGDLARALTKRGRQQARQAAAWLDARLPDRFTVLASPATRAVETAAALTAR